MSFFVALFFWAIAGLAVAGLVYAALASLLVGRFFPPRPTTPVRGRGVTLLKPLYLDEAGLEQNLRSFFEQDYDGPIQVVFGVHGRWDPALGAVERLRRAFPQHDIDIVIDSNTEGTNPKIANLVNMQRHAKHEILVLSDSDIRVPNDYVRTVVAELAETNVGAVTCLYRGIPIKGLWSVLEAMHIDFAFLPNVVSGTSFGLARPCFGSTIALHRRVLDEIGGFRAMSRHLADDYEIGRAVRCRGYDVKISSMIVEHSCSESGWSDLVQHELRWAKTVRVVTGPGHLGSIVTHAFPLALLVAIALGFSGPGLVLLAAALSVRVLLAWRIRRILGSKAGPLWLVPARDMLSFGVFLASLFGNSVYWRGTRYLTTADGVLAQQ